MTESLRLIEKHLANFPKLQIALVFGSYGTERVLSTSDVDLAVASDDILSDLDKLAISQAINDATHRDVDLIDLNAASGTVFKEALTKGRFLFNKSPDLLHKILRRMLFEEEDYQVMKRKLAAEARKRVFDV